MRVDTKDLVRAFQSKGEACEDFVHDLVRAVGRSCGIDPINVDWDYRTNVKDGGRDLVVRVANPRADKQFIPARRSVWSIKAGDAGISPASLKSEIKNHPKVKQALREGWSYVWATVRAADQDQRVAMKNAADEVADELKVTRDLIEFRWPEHLQGELNLFPNLISTHIPELAARLNSVLLLPQWRRQLELSDQWINFGGRDDVVRRVTEHLLSRSPPNVLHIAGLSGIGKTRTVFEACTREPELNGVFYVQEFDQVGPEMYRYLEEDGRNVSLVIDETPLEKVDVIIARLGEFADRVRVVTIGPAVRQASVSRDEILILPEPDTEAGVLEVVRAAGTGLSDDVLRSIAAQSGHDLRLALLVVLASQKLPEFRGVPVVNINGVWQRLMGLFANEIGDPHEFRKFYELLTVSIDVGVAEDSAGEIEALARYFHHPVPHVRACAIKAERCGLGLRTRRFFEASPRALAARLFAEHVWPQIRDVLAHFVPSLPERLRRRFLERCQDCTGPVREEVLAQLGDFFLTVLSGEEITVLASRAASRLFQAWAEFDPRRGLDWLGKAVERALPEQLRALDGDPDGSGGWRGRRQLVWLCQNLASFAEHFDASELILFRLALHETELSIGNNSVAIWQSLFWPALANTEVPFDLRLEILLRRLRTAANDELPLVIGAAIGCVEHRFIGLPVPPRVVGGRVVPKPWRPRTYAELAEQRRRAAREILKAIEALPGDRAGIALRAVVEQLFVFIGLGLFSLVHRLFRPERLDDGLRRALIGKLEKHIALLREAGEKHPVYTDLRLLEEWLAELSPRQLEVRVRDLTAQEYWLAGDQKNRHEQYENLADELIRAPKTLQELANWFDSSEAHSADALGLQIGRRDDGHLAGIVQDWLRTDRCRKVAVSYLIGTVVREGILSEKWAAILDTLAVDQPELAATATACADVSGRGCERLLSLIAGLPPPASRFLRPFASGGWLRVLDSTQRINVATALVHLADSGDPDAAAIGLDIIQMWAHMDKTTINHDLAPLAFDLATQFVSTSRRHDLYSWRRVLTLLSPLQPRGVAELVVGRITQPASSPDWSDEENIEVLNQAASFDARAVMEVVGNAVLDQKRRVVFGIGVFHGLFEAIGPQHVAEWIERHGREHLRWLARHFPSPYLDKAGKPAVPLVTDWLFREHEADNKAFESFLMGRHSGAVWSQSDVDVVRKREEMKPFLKHELRRVREWAEHEIREEEREAQFFREWDEEDERR